MDKSKECNTKNIAILFKEAHGIKVWDMASKCGTWYQSVRHGIKVLESIAAIFLKSRFHPSTVNLCMTLPHETARVHSAPWVGSDLDSKCVAINRRLDERSSLLWL